MLNGTVLCALIQVVSAVLPLLFGEEWEPLLHLSGSVSVYFFRDGLIMRLFH